MPGGPAEAAGLQRGDLVVSVDGRAVHGLRPLYDVIWERGPGRPDPHAGAARRGDPGRAGAGGRPLRVLQVRTLIHDARLVAPMDDARSRFAGRLRARRGRPHRGRGAGAAARAGRSSADRRIDAQRQGRAARPRQHPPPPAADPDPQRAAGAGGAALPLARRALRGLARPRRRRGRRPRRASASASCCSPAAPPRTDHLYLFPRGQERLIDVEIAAARELGHPLPPDARLDEPRQEPGRPAARRRVPGRGDDPRRLAAPRSASTTTRGRAR